MTFQSIGELAARSGSGRRSGASIIFSVRKVQKSQKNLLSVSLSEDFLKRINIQIGETVDFGFDASSNKWKIFQSQNGVGFKIFSASRTKLSGIFKTTIQPSFPVLSNLSPGTRLKGIESTIKFGERNAEFMIESVG